MLGLVFDIQRYAIHDGPGIRTVVFLKGCPLRCAWCHNPESQDAAPELVLTPGRCIACGACVQACPEDAAATSGTHRGRCVRCGQCVAVCPSGARRIAGREMSAPEVLDEVERDRLFFEQSAGGVTFSGGEPLMQSDFLRACLSESRRRGIHTAVDTCGYADPAILRDIAALTDLFLYDLKLIDDRRHQEFTGVSNRVILQNLGTLSNRGAAVWVRLPLISGINDDDENVAATCRFLADLSPRPAVQLLPYHRGGHDKAARLGRTVADDAAPPAPGRLAEVADALGRCGLDVRIGG